jgi:hypothetical protein
VNAAEVDVVSADLQQTTRKLANAKAAGGPTTTPMGLPTPKTFANSPVPMGMPPSPAVDGGDGGGAAVSVPKRPTSRDSRISLRLHRHPS